MTTYERRQSLMDLLRKQPGLRVPEIAQTLGVSEGTVRNDLNALEEDGHLTRVHGGAVLSNAGHPSNLAFGIRHQEHSREKNYIGQTAAQLVNDGDSILLDASSTAYYLALNLKERSRLRVVTNGIELARLLAQNTSNTVILIGGVVNPDGSSVTGLLSEQIIAELRIQKAFVSCSGFSVESGMTEVHLEEAQLKRKAIESARQVFALVDSSKMGHEDLTPIARTEKITHLFTDADITDEWKSKLKAANIPFTICEEQAAPTK
ncbi:MAG: DeoR/GlpR transcriptional regulator [Chloroflexi bacterium]|nr:DeoR/GlpR transcriptional regulator [Chloroflexota bacterium]